MRLRTRVSPAVAGIAVLALLCTPQAASAAGPVHAGARGQGSGLDPFGVEMLHPSVGKQWFSRWDSRSARTHTTAGQPVEPPELGFANSDQTADVYGSSGSRAGQMRIYGPVPRVYVRKTSRSPHHRASRQPTSGTTWRSPSTPTARADSGVGYAGLEAVAKTNHWPDGWQCTSGGYGARMLFDGRIDFEKELYHSPNTNFRTPALTRHWTSAAAPSTAGCRSTAGSVSSSWPATSTRATTADGRTTPRCASSSTRTCRSAT